MNRPLKPGSPNDPAPADGPARVMKGSDWGAVAEAGFRGFPMEALAMPGRTAPKPTPEQSRAVQLERDLRKSESDRKEALAKAKAEGESSSRAAFARGREEGLREGEKRALEHYEKSLDDLRRNASVALDVLSREKAALFLEFEGQALELVSAAIHRVFEGFAAQEAEAVLPLIRKAMAALGQANSITLKVNPADFKTATGNQDFWLPIEAGGKDVRVLADERIAPGGCYVESDSTSVAMRADELAERIDDELKRVFAAKAQALKSEAPPESGPAAGASDAEGTSPAGGADGEAMPPPQAGG
jgi:flagellar biosynthesis/type III secretory pathway protein FliH